MPDSPEVSCVVSIGTGYAKKSVQQPGWGFFNKFSFNTVRTAVSYATNTEAKHQDFQRKIARLGIRKNKDIPYFRFNVELNKEINLDDWQSMSKLEKITRDQLKDENGHLKKMVEDCVARLAL